MYFKFILIAASKSDSIDSDWTHDLYVHITADKNNLWNRVGIWTDILSVVQMSVGQKKQLKLNKMLDRVAGFDPGTLCLDHDLSVHITAGQKMSWLVSGFELISCLSKHQLVKKKLK